MQNEYSLERAMKTHPIEWVETEKITNKIVEEKYNGILTIS